MYEKIPNLLTLNLKNEKHSLRAELGYFGKLRNRGARNAAALLFSMKLNSDKN